MSIKKTSSLKCAIATKPLFLIGRNIYTTDFLFCCYNFFLVTFAKSHCLFVTDDTAPQGNPFKMPPDSDIFLMRDKERQRKKQVSFVS